MFFTHNFTHGWLNSYLLIDFYMRLSSVLWRFLKWNVRDLDASRILLRVHCWLYSACYIPILIHPSLLLLVWLLGVFISIDLYRVYFVDVTSYLVSFRCVFVIYLFHTHNPCSCNFSCSCEMILGCSHLRVHSVAFHYTYIYNWPLQSFSKDYWPNFSYHICCVY